MIMSECPKYILEINDRFNRQLRLFSAESKGGSNNLWDIRNLLTQKFPEERFKVFAKLGFCPHMGLGENAGMVAMGSSYAGFRLADDTGSARLQYIVCNDAENGGEEKVEPAEGPGWYCRSMCSSL